MERAPSETVLKQSGAQVPECSGMIKSIEEETRRSGKRLTVLREKPLNKFVVKK